MNTELLNFIIPTVKDVSFCPFDKISDHLIKCRKISLIPEHAKTVIMCAFPYLVDADYSKRTISKYACVADYHVVLKKRLETVCNRLKQAYPKNKFVEFADDSPIPEVLAGTKSGLGVLGNNGLLITKEYGSFVFLGEIVTDLEMETIWLDKTPTCINCGKCGESCPSECIGIGKGKDKKICASNLSQQKRNLTDDEIKIVKKSGLMWGCDVCQDVCPLNFKAKTTYIKEFKTRYCLNFADDYLNGDFPYAYLWRGAKVIERNKKLFIGEKKKKLK